MRRRVMPYRVGCYVRGGMATFALLVGVRAAGAQRDDSVSVRVVNTDLRSAVQLMGQYLDRPVIFSGGAGQSPMVTLETPRPVARRDVVRLLRGLLESQNFELVSDTAALAYRARPREAPHANAASAQASPPMQNQTMWRPQSTGPELFVIALKHARASDVASTVNALFGRGSNGLAGRMDSPSRGATLADELRANLVPPTGAAPPEAMAGAAGRIATLSGDVTIVPDSRANSLLIRANRADFALIGAAVEQVDVRPLQVLIEVLIVEARRNHSFEYGVDASIGARHVHDTENTTIGGGFNAGNGSAGLGDFTIKVMGVGGYDLNATITAAESRGDARIISRPVVLAANNEKAEVVVGSQRPFVQVSRSLPTESPVQDRVVQYKDVGIKLSVTPTISIDGSVQLDVSQEVSNATTETAFNAPVIATRSVKTQLIVRDNQTVVLGGLRDQERDVTKGGVPLLSSIPLLGGLFGHYSRQTTDTELFIFITPRVIRTDADAAAASGALRARADIVKP